MSANFPALKPGDEVEDTRNGRRGRIIYDPGNSRLTFVHWSKQDSYPESRSGGAYRRFLRIVSAVDLLGELIRG